MTDANMIRPFVERAVAQALGLESIRVDEDGDIPVVNETSVTFVRVLDGPVGPMVRFFSPVVAEVRKSSKLLERLNEMNVGVPYVQFFWVGEQIICNLDLDAESLQPEEVGKALSAVMWHANKFDEPLQEEFGGRTMIPPEESRKPPITGPTGPAGYL